MKKEKLQIRYSSAGKQHHCIHKLQKIGKYPMMSDITLQVVEVIFSDITLKILPVR